MLTLGVGGDGVIVDRGRLPDDSPTGPLPATFYPNEATSRGEGDAGDTDDEAELARHGVRHRRGDDDDDDSAFGTGDLPRPQSGRDTDAKGSAAAGAGEGGEGGGGDNSGGGGGGEGDDELTRHGVRHRRGQGSDSSSDGEGDDDDEMPQLALNRRPLTIDTVKHGVRHRQSAAGGADGAAGAPSGAGTGSTERKSAFVERQAARKAAEAAEADADKALEEARANAKKKRTSRQSDPLLTEGQRRQSMEESSTASGVRLREMEQEIAALKATNQALTNHIQAGGAGGGPIDMEEIANAAFNDEWKGIAVSMLDPQTGVERITADIVASVYPELAGATVFTGAECARWLQSNVDSIESDDDVWDAAFNLLKSTSMGHADERNVDSITDFLPENNVWYFSFSGVGKRPSLLADASGHGGDSEATVCSFQAMLEEEDCGDQQISAPPPELTIEELFQAAFGQPLLEAILGGARKKVLKKLIAQEGVHVRDSQKRSALMYAVLTHQPATCSLLVKHGVDTEARDSAGNTALLIATHLADTLMMAKLLALGARLDTGDRDEQTALHWSCRHQATEGLRALLFHKSCRKYLVNRQDIKEQLSPLHWAVAAGARDHVVLLMEKGAEPSCMDARGRTVMDYCSYFDQPECLVNILNLDPKWVKHRNSKGRTSLHFTCGKYGWSTQCLKLLLSSTNATVNATDLKLRTPLHICAIHHRVQVGKALIKLGANPNAKDVGGYTPLHYAMHLGDVDMVALLEGSQEEVERAAEQQRRASQTLLRRSSSELSHTLNNLEEEAEVSPAAAAAAGQWLRHTDNAQAERSRALSTVSEDHEPELAGRARSRESQGGAEGGGGGGGGGGAPAAQQPKSSVCTIC